MNIAVILGLPGSTKSSTQNIHVKNARDLVQRVAGVIEGYAMKMGVSPFAVEYEVVR